MTITLNNRPEDFVEKSSMTVRELLEAKNFTFKFLVVRVNGKTIMPDDYDKAEICDGDDVKVIHLISGG